MPSTSIAGTTGTPAETGDRAGLHLVAEAAHRFGRRSHPSETRRNDLLRERRILREEAVARMHRVGARNPRPTNERRTVEV